MRSGLIIWGWRVSSSKRRVRGTICFDFDGVLSQGAEYHWPLTGLDLAPLAEAQRRGYAVVVMTCNRVGLVAAELRLLGYVPVADVSMVRESWHDPERVLVTGRKVCADAYVDDRAVRWSYGEPVSAIFEALGEVSAA
jgi:hypothetical protein